MSVTDRNVIDFIGKSKESGQVILTISDHLDWTDNEHLIILQDKINDYIKFIESNEIYRSYPDAINNGLEINIVFKILPSENSVAHQFLLNVENILNKLYFGFRYYSI